MKKAITEIRGMDTHDLRGKLAELRKEQFDMRFHGAAEQVARTSRHKEIRRTIARIQLVLAERDPGASGSSPQQAAALQAAAPQAAATQKAATQTAAPQKAATSKSAGGKKR
jgi:large subunit ribosomal protein L29